MTMRCCAGDGAESKHGARFVRGQLGLVVTYANEVFSGAAEEPREVEEPPEVLQL